MSWLFLFHSNPTDDWRKVKLGSEKAPRIRIRVVIWIFGISVMILMIIRTSWSIMLMMITWENENRFTSLLFQLLENFILSWLSCKSGFCLWLTFLSQILANIAIKWLYSNLELLFSTHSRDIYHIRFSIDWNITSCFLIIDFNILILNSSLPL